MFSDHFYYSDYFIILLNYILIFKIFYFLFVYSASCLNVTSVLFQITNLLRTKKGGKIEFEKILLTLKQKAKRV